LAEVLAAETAAVAIAVPIAFEQALFAPDSAAQHSTPGAGC